MRYTSCIATWKNSVQYLHITVVEDVSFSNMENGNKQSLSSILIVDILQKDLNLFFYYLVGLIVPFLLVIYLYSFVVFLEN